MNKTRFRRVLLKLSGEGLMGDDEYGLNHEVLVRLAQEIKAVREIGVEVALVVGGGNIFRGISGAARGMERTSADNMGMLATVINALALQNVLQTAGVPALVQSAIPMPTVCDPYIRRHAVEHLSQGKVVIFAAGTGNPFFTTDTAAALRAIETDCDALLKATQVDGVYDSDPKKNPNAKRYDKLSYQEVLTKDLKVMDAAAIALSRENKLPVLVFSLQVPGIFREILMGSGFCTLINEEG